MAKNAIVEDLLRILKQEGSRLKEKQNVTFNPTSADLPFINIHYRRRGIFLNQNVLPTLFQALPSESQMKTGEVRKLGFKEYLEDWEFQHIVERAFQQAIQSCIDIGARLIAQNNFSKADDFHGVFDVLSQEKVISGELAEKMKEMVGFRNALVHEYRQIKHEKVYRHLQESLGVFQKFAESIIKFLEK